MTQSAASATGCRSPPLICAQSHQCHWTQLVSLREHQSVRSGRPVTNSNGYHFKYVGPPLSLNPPRRCVPTPAPCPDRWNGLNCGVNSSNQVLESTVCFTCVLMLVSISCHAENSAKMIITLVFSEAQSVISVFCSVGNSLYCQKYWHPNSIHHQTTMTCIYGYRHFIHWYQYFCPYNGCTSHWCLLMSPSEVFSCFLQTSQVLPH